MLRFVDKGVWVVTAVAAAICLVEAFAHSWLEDIFGHHVTELWVNLALATVSAFIFYLFVDVVRRWHDARSIAPSVSQQIRTMLGDIEAVCREVAIVGGLALPADWSFNDNDVARFFNKVGPNSQSKSLLIGNGQPASIFDFMVERATRTEKAISNLILLAPFIGAQGMARVRRVQESSYLGNIRAINQWRHLGIRNKNLDIFVNLIVSHHSSLKELEAWARRSHFWEE